MLQISQNLQNTPVALSEDGHLVLLMRALHLQVWAFVGCGYDCDGDDDGIETA
jgi:hypothetical protein